MCGPAPCDKPDCTWSENARAQAEIRHLRNMASDWEREQYLKLVASSRGDATAEALRAEVQGERKATSDPRPPGHFLRSAKPVQFSL